MKKYLLWAEHCARALHHHTLPPLQSTHLREHLQDVLFVNGDNWTSAAVNWIVISWAQQKWGEKIVFVCAPVCNHTRRVYFAVGIRNETKATHTHTLTVCNRQRAAHTLRYRDNARTNVCVSKHNNLILSMAIKWWILWSALNYE